MKRLSNGRRSSKTPPARVTMHSYEPDDEGITTQKIKFASLYEEDDEAVAEEEEEGDDDEEAEAGYARRQKHRKIWRISSIKNGVNNQHQQQKFVCSKCGKGFQSLKAKCGHMASHSEKEKAPTSNLVVKEKVAMDDSQSDTESGAQRLTRRSRRTKYKKHTLVYSVGSKAKVDAYKNFSSEDSGVEQEQEEVAISLMMLSRDSANWGGLNSFEDSSDNNSVALEARSISTKLAQKDGLSTGHRVDEAWEKCSSKKATALGESESLFVRYGANNVQMEPEVNIRNVMKNKFDEESKTEPHLSLKKLERVMDAGLIRDGKGYSHTVRPSMDLYLNRRALNEPCIAGYNGGNQYSNTEMYQRFERKVLIHSQFHQAFNARADNHKNLTAASPYKSDENSFETDPSLDMRKGKGILEQNLSNVGDKLKKGKHECPVCSEVFKSGRALGGHSRAHLSDKSDEVAANFKQSGIQLHEVIDLNLSAPMEDYEASESMASYSRVQPLSRP